MKNLDKLSSAYTFFGSFSCNRRPEGEDCSKKRTSGLLNEELTKLKLTMAEIGNVFTYVKKIN